MRERPSRLTSSSGKRRFNRRLPAQKPSASGSGLFLRIRNFWSWLLAQRFHYAAVFFALCWVLLWFRAFQVQVVRGPDYPKYKENLENQHYYMDTVEGERGNILDRNGHILARSISCQSVCANPHKIQDINDAAKRLATILKRNPSELVAEFNKKNSFIWLKRNLDDATAAAIEKETIPGIGLRREIVSCQSAYANPGAMQDIDDAAKRLAPILKRNASDLVAEFNKKSSFILLCRNLDDATAAAIEEEAIPGIGLRRESVSCQSVYANPGAIQNTDDAAKRLAPILKCSVSELVDDFNKKRSFIWLERKVDDATAAAIRKEAIPGIALRNEYERVYPYRHLAGQLLGFVGLDNHGLEGVELAYDKTLCGTKSERRLSRNAAERLLSGKQASVEEQRGDDISLTIDIQIQSIAEDVLQEAVQACKAKWGGVLVADSQSGEILAWAQYPFFNPNKYREYSFNLYRNRLAGDSMEPGSTFKPFLMASALQENIVNPSTVLFCENGVWRTKYANIRDDTHSFANLTATEILSHSSNIGVAKISLQLGAQKFYSYLSRLNFGQRTGIGIHEAKGILRRPKEWSELDLMTSAFGQSLSVTGIQMLQAYTVLANGGEFHPLRLVLDREGSSSDVTHTQRIFSKKTTREVLKMMEEVVDGGGTGSRARIPGVRVAGKTGTAQKAAKKNTGYSDKRLASFGGIVPADAPRYVIYVMIDEPSTTSYGGVVSAPVFQQVAARTLAYGGYLPDVVFEQTQVKKKPSVNPEQRKKDEIYLANLARYREAQAKKAQKRQKGKDAPGIMPDLAGMSLRRAMETCAALGIIPSIAGEGSFVVKQYPAPGITLVEDSSCTVWLTDDFAPRETPSKE